jgi:subtilisin-like proprotein convertase family protein
MKNSTFAILSVFALSAPAFGQTAAKLVSDSTRAYGTAKASHADKLRDLTLCTHEICYSDPSGKLHIEPVAAASTDTILAQASMPDAGKFLVFYPKGQEMNPKERRILRNRYVMKVSEKADLELIRQRCGIKSLKRLSSSSEIVLCEEESAGKVLAQVNNVVSDPDVLSAEPLFARKRYKRLIPSDPFYNSDGNPRPDEAYQWYLNNEGINGGVADIDINIESALDRATGDGVTVGIVDDGLAIDHVDLATNATGPHLNLLDGDPADPSTLNPLLNHGTNVAGLIGAEFRNDEGISGAAPEATLSGIRLLGDAIDDADEALAFGFSRNIIDIYNSGFGPDDDVLNFDGPGQLTQLAILDGILDGRPQGNNALGNIFVWPAGNGGEIGDNSNYDGYANSPYTIAVGSVTDGGVRAPYSERGSNLVVVAPSSGGASDVLTTSFALGVDQDDNPIRIPEYDPGFTGTSASAALVSGVVALMLEENPSLTWRDVQDILIRTAVTVDPDNAEWITNGAGIDFNDNYGAGMVDAQGAVIGALAANPANRLGPLAPPIVNSRFFTDQDPNSPDYGVVPDNDGGSLLIEFDMTQDGNGPRENLKVEHVVLSATIVTDNRAELEIVLISPNGTRSVLQTPDENHVEQSIFFWEFMTVRNWGEGSGGKWVVQVTDTVTGNPAFVNNMSLVVYGSEDPDAPVSEIPLLTSARSLTLNQGAPFTYQIQTTGASSVEVGDLPPGLVYDPVALTISGTPTRPGLYDVDIILRSDTTDDGEFVVVFEVNPTAVALGDAVGLPDVPATFGGDLPWDFELVDTNDGNVPDPRSARSAVNLGDNQQSIFGFDGLPQGVIYFDWKTSSEEGFDRLWFNLGGEVPQEWNAFLSGERDWGRAAVMLPNPTNNVRWIYSKDFSISEGEDRGLVDNVEVVTMSKYREDLIAAANIEGFDFELDSRTLFVPTDLLGNSPAPGEQIPSSILTSTVGNGQTVSISGWVEGPGTFSFVALNYAEPADLLEFLVDGVVVASQPGAGAGGQVALLDINRTIREGRHRVQLRFRKDFRGSDAADLTGTDVPFDGAVFDDIKFVPDDNFEGFASQYGVGADIDPNGDVDQDGYSNYQEYAFGGNLIVADVPRYLPRLVQDGQNSFIEYGLDTSRLDLTYLPQQSGDLENWVEAELANLDRVEGNVQVFRIPVASGPGRRNLFYRVIARAR